MTHPSQYGHKHTAPRCKRIDVDQARANLRTLRHQREAHENKIWKRYGFVEAWNPHTGWVNPNVIGIDVGITALMAANLRDSFVWRTMQRDSVVQQGLRRAGRASGR